MVNVFRALSVSKAVGLLSKRSPYLLEASHAHLVTARGAEGGGRTEEEEERGPATDGRRGR